MIPTRPIEFIYQYPSIFREFFPAGAGFQPHIKLGDAFFERAELKMAMGRRGKVESAIGDLDRAVELSPENARAFCLLEECYEAKKMEAEVRKAYEDALRIEPELALAREALDQLVSMATKMANVEKAEELLEKLRSASWDAVVQDMEDLKDFSKKQGASEADDLNHWDISFWSERLRESKYDINEEELRPYFSLPKVMDGLFNLAKTLFGIEIKPANGLAPVWNKDVRFYCVKDSSANPIAYFYFDPYTRPSEKRGGAWMDEVVSRSRVLSRNGTSARLSVAHMFVVVFLVVVFCQILMFICSYWIFGCECALKLNLWK